MKGVVGGSLTTNSTNRDMLTVAHAHTMLYEFYIHILVVHHNPTSNLDAYQRLLPPTSFNGYP